MQCQECGTAKGRYEHPDYSGDSLCAGCFRGVAEGKIEELEEEIKSLQDQINNIGRRKRAKAT